MFKYITIFVILASLCMQDGSCQKNPVTEICTLLDEVLPIVTGVSDNCVIVISEICSDPKKDWVSQMMDATAKIPPGLQLLRLYTFGSYEECIDIEVNNCTLTDKCQETPILGQYCSLSVQTEEKMNESSTYGAGGLLSGSANTLYRMGICLPSYCSSDDLNSLLKYVSFPIPGNISLIPGVSSEGVQLKLNISGCQTKEKDPLSGSQIAIVSVFAVLGFFLVTGSLTDIFLNLTGLKTSAGEIEVYNRGTKLICQLLLSFSLITNGKKLLNTKTGKEDLSAIHGIRFMSMSWVILGHTYAFMNFAALGNLKYILDYTKKFLFQVVLNGTLSVDSFFFLSGLLVSYYFLKEYKKRHGHYNWFLHYFHRIWRLTPAYAMVIALAILWPQFGTGPLWKDSVDKVAHTCEKGWWTSILYINNLVTSGEMCLGHGWYLSNDTQFYVVAPIILLLLFRWEIVGHIFNLLVLICASIATGVIIKNHSYPPTITINVDLFNTVGGYFQDIYIKPYCRIGPYCIGLAVGHILQNHKNFKISKGIQAVAWILATVLSLLSLFGVYDWNDQRGQNPSDDVSALYGSTYRVAWTLSLAWVTVACLTGRGGFINDFLSWKLFVPLGRLTYMAYLLHPLVMYTTSGLTRETIIFGHYNMVIYFLAHLLLSYLAAFIGSVAFEAPFLGLEKIMFRREDTKKEVLSVPLPYNVSFPPTVMIESSQSMPPNDYFTKHSLHPDENTSPNSLDIYENRKSAVPSVTPIQIQRLYSQISSDKSEPTGQKSPEESSSYSNSGFIPDDTTDTSNKL